MALHPLALTRAGLLHRILQRAVGGPLEVVVRHLEVVFFRHRIGVADPIADDVDGPVLCEFRLARRPQVVEQLRPPLLPGSPQDATHLRPQVGSLGPMSLDDVFGPFVGEVKRGLEVGK